MHVRDIPVNDFALLDVLAEIESEIAMRETDCERSADAA